MDFEGVAIVWMALEDSEKSYFSLVRGSGTRRRYDRRPAYPTSAIDHFVDPTRKADRDGAEVRKWHDRFELIA